jgi:hypothetical protein
MLHMTARVIFGPVKTPDEHEGHDAHPANENANQDIGAREIGLLVPIAVAVIVLGVLPRIVLVPISGPLAAIQVAPLPDPPRPPLSMPFMSQGANGTPGPDDSSVAINSAGRSP